MRPVAAGSSALSSKEYRAAVQDTAAARVDVAAAPMLSHWDWDCRCGRLEECTVRVDCCC